LIYATQCRELFLRDASPSRATGWRNRSPNSASRCRYSSQALVTSITALLLSRVHAAIAGSLGTLVGADLLNLGKIAGLGTPVASIGGAGTFDGIFLTGILAVLLASLTGERRPATS
jgi:hypothetical protein